jgi:exonuclease III
MENFRDTLSMCDLHDIGPYTWDNGWSGNANVRVRLDRAVANTAWRDLFTDAKVCHLISSRSDHCSVLVEVKERCLGSTVTQGFQIRNCVGKG